MIRAERALIAHRSHCETTRAAKSWKTARRVIARIEATTPGMDIRTIVTSLKDSTPERLHESTCCDRGQAENLIKLHKTRIKSDRTSCTSAAANQMRLISRTAAYRLPWSVQKAVPEGAALKRAEFATLQIRLVKIGARVIETATRIRVAFASACPDKELIAHLVRSLTAAVGQRSQAPQAPRRIAPRPPQRATQNPSGRAGFRARLPLGQNRSGPDQVIPKPAQSSPS